MKRLLFFTFFSLVSCSKEYYFQRDQEKISEDLKVIVSTDQSVRKNLTGIHSRYKIRSFYTITDSIYRYGDKKSNFDYSSMPSIEKQVAKMSLEIASDYKEEIQRSETLMKFIDSINHNKLYSIIKKYGYPSYDNRKWKSEKLRIGVTFVLTHAWPDSDIGKKYFDILIKEYDAGRFDEGSMRHYLWHFEGRSGMMDFDSKIEDLIKKAKEKRKLME